MLSRLKKYFSWRKVDESGVSNPQEVREYIRNNSMDAFIYKRKAIGDNIALQYLVYSIKLMLIYFLLLTSIYGIMDDKWINATLYDLLTYLKIPIRSPDGWNVSYVLTFFFSIFVFYTVLKYENTFWVFEMVGGHGKGKIKIIFAKICLFYISLAVFPLGYYIIPDFKGGECGLIRDMCFLYTESMFFFDSLMTYLMCTMFFAILYRTIFELNVKAE
jgi:hypothetical protein